MIFFYLLGMKYVCFLKKVASVVKNSEGRKVNLFFDFLQFSSNSTVFLNFRKVCFKHT
jgi:hypothetical protein